MLGKWLVIIGSMHGDDTTTARTLIGESTRRKLAVLADVDPRTIDKVILGQPVRGAAGIRALAVLAECGIAPLDGQDAAPATKGEQS